MSLGNINKGSGPPDWWLDARLMILMCEKIIVMKSKAVETGTNLAESSKANAQKRLFCQ
jgi:hypothetical protein